MTTIDPYKIYQHKGSGAIVRFGPSKHHERYQAIGHNGNILGHFFKYQIEQDFIPADIIEGRRLLKTIKAFKTKVKYSYRKRKCVICEHQIHKESYTKRLIDHKHVNKIYWVNICGRCLEIEQP